MSECERVAAAIDGAAPAPPRLLRLPEAADLLSVSRRTVERLIDRGELRSVVVSVAAVRVRADDLAAYIGAITSMEG